MKLRLIIDDRERAVTPFIPKDCPHTISRINIGDYSIVDDTSGKILCIFERKTLEDFAASLKDGRYQNKEHLIKLRESTGCSIYYIVEGNPFARETQYIGSTPYYYIESAQFHLMQRDAIYIINSQSPEYTAKKLHRMLNSLSRMYEKKPAIQEPPKSSEEAPKPAEEVPMETSADVTSGSAPNQIDILTEKVDKSCNTILTTMWSVFKGIGSINAESISSMLALQDIIKSETMATLDKLIHITTSGNPRRKVSESVISSIASYISAGPAQKKIIDVKLLSCIPGISAGTAAEILEPRTLKDLLSMETGLIAIIKVGKKQSSIGPKKALFIRQYFQMKFA